jgi:hypothetical protein
MAVNQSITKKFNPNFKSINYLTKTFPEFRQNLIEFAKSYYPNTYSDFNEASPGMMFIEMAAYVGDVLSFYIDNQFKENLLLFANERQNVINISQAFGYKPRLAAPATVEAKIYQMVPSVPSKNYDPDSRYFLKILTNSKFSAQTQPVQSFRSIDDVDFSDAADREIVVLSRGASNEPTMYLVSKKIKLIASDVKTATFTFGSPQKFSKIELSDSNVIGIQSIVDSDGYTWYEVDYLGQDLLIEERNVATRNIDGFFTEESLPTGSLPPAKLAILRRKSRRFATRINSNLKMELWFGSGTDEVNDDIITLNSGQIANSKYNQAISNTSLDPSDFISSDTFGLAPANTTLTVTYLVGGGVESNVPSNTITNVDIPLISNTINDFETATERNLYNQVVSSLAVLNEVPARGGGSVETIEEIRQNALAFFNAQNRAVTDKDYVVRSLAMPPKFGTIAKVFVVRDEQINAIGQQQAGNLVVNNDIDPFNNRVYVEDPVAPNSINLYVLGYDSRKKLATLNRLVKQNLSKYLEQYRVLTDDVNILDAFIVNIGVEFEIIVYRNYNMNDVLARCIDAIKTFFDIDKWQINQPIVLNDLELSIGSVEGVQSVVNVTVFDKYRFRDGREYAETRYPIEEALVDDVIYPSLDPCIFEIKYPETDIIGHARQ